MRNFKLIKVLSFLFFISIIIYAVIDVAFNDTFRKLDNNNYAEWLVIGNSHAYKILMNTTSVYYLNEDGANLDERIKQIEFGLKTFKNSKYIILNISPLEMYKLFYFSTNENEYLYKKTPLDILNFFEGRLVNSPLYLFEDTSKYNYFLPNGRRVSYGIHSRKEGDWIRKPHFDNGYYPSVRIYNKNLKKLEKMIDMLKSKHTIILISMPLHPTYINHIKHYLASYEVPDLNRFFYDMNHLDADCYINLTSYPMSEEMFWDGDHLNENGAIAIKPTLYNRFQSCISKEKDANE